MIPCFARRLRISAATALAFAPLALLAPRAAAQVVPGGQGAPNAQPAEESQLKLNFSAIGVYDFRADVDEGGSVSIGRAGAAFGIAAPIAERLRARLDLAFEASFYDWENSALIPGAPDPFSDLYSTLIAPTLAWQIDDNWSVTAGARFVFAGQAQTNASDAFLPGGFFYAAYTFSPTFTLSLGAAASARFDDDALIVPLIGFDWKPSDTVHIYTEGLGLTIATPIAEDWTLSVTGKWQPREYRLEDSGPLPDGAFRDDSVLIGVEVAWKPSPNIELALQGGGVVYENFKTLDRNGNEVSDINSDPTPYLGVRFLIQF